MTGARSVSGKWNRRTFACSLVTIACSVASPVTDAAPASLPAKACQQMIFTHIGEQDAAIPEITVAVGRPSYSSGTLVLVSAKTYAALRSQLFMVQAPAQVSTMTFGTFNLEDVECGQVARQRRVGPTEFLAALDRVKRDLLAGEALPDTVARVETMVRRLSASKQR